MSALPKPVLRGHIKRRGIKGLIGALTVSVFNGAMFHFLVANPRRDAYEEFVKTYDADAHYKELLKYGYINPGAFGEELKNLKN